MPNYRRARVPGGSYFFTVVVDRRWNLFANATARSILGSVIRRCQLRRTFRINAFADVAVEPTGLSRRSSALAVMTRIDRIGRLCRAGAEDRGVEPRGSKSRVEAGRRGEDEGESRRGGEGAKKRRGDAETRRRGDAGTRRRGDAGTRRRGDAGTRRRGDAETLVHQATGRSGGTVCAAVS